MRRQALKYGSLVIGILAAVIIIVSQSFAFKSTAAVEKAANAQTSAQSEDNETPENKPGSITISATNFPAAAQVNFFHEASCLFEVIFNHDIPIGGTDSFELPLDKFFTALFSVLISPNAP